MGAPAQVDSKLTEVQEALVDIPATIKSLDDARRTTEIIEYLVGVTPGGIATMAQLMDAARFHLRDRVGDLVTFLAYCADLSEAWAFRD